MDTLVKEHEIRVVAQLGRWDEEDVVLDDTSILREVPSIFYCFTNQTTPRLLLMSNSIAEMKRGILHTVVSSGASSADAGGAYGQLGQHICAPLDLKVTEALCREETHVRMRTKMCICSAGVQDHPELA